MIMKIKDLMTSDVVTAAPEASLKDVAKTLVEHRISGMPVCGEDGRILGVVSEGDILHKERGRIERRGGPLAWLVDGTSYTDVAKAHARTAREAMTAPAITIAPHRPAAAAARLMVEKGVNRLPVVASDGTLLGIVTRADLVRAFTRSDEEIAEEIREDVLRRGLWVDPGLFQITVRDGEVELAGELETRPDAVVVEKLVERIPGVVSLRSSLTHRADDASRAGRFAGYR
jgi:CBS domain-containing protein